MSTTNKPQDTRSGLLCQWLEARYPPEFPDDLKQKIAIAVRQTGSLERKMAAVRALMDEHMKVVMES